MKFMLEFCGKWPILEMAGQAGGLRNGHALLNCAVETAVLASSPVLVAKLTATS